MRVINFLVIISMVIIPSLFINSVSADEVKRSRSGLCHDKTSHSFNSMKYYDSYNSLSSCLAVPGSRLPKHMQDSLKKKLSSKKAYDSFNQSSYNRNNWKHWNKGLNVHDCVNTRHETLARQAVSGTVRMSKDGCFVSSGKWNGMYSGDVFYDPRKMDIDHIIPLNYAFRNGGANWPKSKKEVFANDPINLIAVSASLNRQKSAMGPAQWLPPNQPYRCQYTTRWNNVLIKYPSIVMPSGEQRIFNKMKRACVIN
jgi:hypothetical protein